MADEAPILKPATAAKERVKKRFPMAGAELSAMWGWRIADYSDPYNPVYLNRGCKTEDAAWRSVDTSRCR